MSIQTLSGTKAPTTGQALDVARPTRHLLTALVVANPLWLAVSLTQAATRPGFDLTEQPLSALSSGGLGWLQITNFVVAGVLAVIGAAGLRRSLPSRWIPRWVALYGVGYVLCGVFTLEHRMAAHLVVGTMAFLALIGALVALARHFHGNGHRPAAAVSVFGAAAVVAANVAPYVAPYPSVTLAVGVGTGMLTLSLAAATVRRRL